MKMGTLRWYWLDGDGYYGAIDCRSLDSAKKLAHALLVASEREIHKFQYIFTEADYSESVIEWSVDEVST